MRGQKDYSIEFVVTNFGEVEILARAKPKPKPEAEAEADVEQQLLRRKPRNLVDAPRDAPDRLRKRPVLIVFINPLRGRH